ncbi:MAG: hypothetical protein LBN38_08705 [Verrucomicrobiota bacterium]|jgi:hypothetical protein|nr:hypothetical protein [Verrucomicrobiota bacterium]
MKMAAREMNLLGITLAVVWLAATYWFMEPKFAEWSDFAEQREELEERLNMANRLLDSRETVEERLAEFSEGLPVFPAGRRADSELLPALERLASQQGLVLMRRETDAEREAGDLYETTITCQWEGDLDALVKFLYAQQSQGMVSDIRQLTVQPMGGQGQDGRLRGTFAMDHAYRRASGGVDNQPEAAALAAVEGAQP